MSDVFSERMGKNVARYRRLSGLTQAELAERVSVSTAFISRVERGEKMVRVQTLYAISQVLGVSCDALLGEECPETHLRNIEKLLAAQPAEYLAGIEKVIRACVEGFEPRRGRR